MALDKSYQIDPETGEVQNLGQFTTRDNIISVEQVRNDLAVKPEFKSRVTHTQEFEIKEGTQIQESIVGPQYGVNGEVYKGGGNQIHILPQKGVNISQDALIPIGQPKEIR